jgi:hypothetical protein
MTGRGSWEARARTLLAALEAERRLVRRGALSDLAGHGAQAAKALEALLAAEPPSDRKAAAAKWREIREAADRNRRLLAAALEGAQGARVALEAQAQARRRLGYDRHGGALLATSAERPRRA